MNDILLKIKNMFGLFIYILIFIIIIYLNKIKIWKFKEISNFFANNNTPIGIYNFVFSLNFFITINSFIGVFIETPFLDQKTLYIVYLPVLILIYGFKIAIEKNKKKFYKMFLLTDDVLGYYLLPLKFVLVVTKPFLLCFSRVYITGIIKHEILKEVSNVAINNAGKIIGIIILLIEMSSIVISSIIFRETLTYFLLDCIH